MHRWLGFLVAGSAIAAMGAAPNPAMARTAPPAVAGQNPDASAPQIAWREGDVEDAFAEAREKNKPVLLYWGAKWCPPCNQLKQSLFKDPTFIAETRNFIPVHLDGDAPDAQKWGERFGIAGYPTVIVLLPDRTEVTRLSGGSMADTLTGVLKLAAARTSSTEDLLARAETPGALTPADWQLLSSFDWLDDPKHVGDLARGSVLVDKLAKAAPDPAMRRHFALTALLMASGDAEQPRLSAAQQSVLRQTLPGILSSYAEVKNNRQELAEGTASLILALPAGKERSRLSHDLIAAMDRVAADDSLPLGDRLSSIDPEIVLSKAANHGAVPQAVLAKVRARVAMADRLATNPQMRQGVMPGAGEALIEAGDPKGGAALWEAELPHAVAPFYYMADLSDLAAAEKNDAAALDWSRKAAESAVGPATRIQWAIRYSEAVMRLEPTDKQAVSAAASMVVDRLAHDTAGYAERTQRKVARWGDQLRAWSARNDGAAVLAQLGARLDAACAGNRCQNVLKT
ncbi:thioredoxin family protein [Acetobacteraceae bacterium KSS8]|uniref:Thioredoxin family protein n=1 Tax=Endosaccharibacter trunci TaxID=2812733 RepID=A0ABT1WA23_9PROT|nr:thioredoxin family protein [Acetobacteraceae bacterium KSS8]